VRSFHESELAVSVASLSLGRNYIVHKKPVKKEFRPDLVLEKDSIKKRMKVKVS